MTAEQIKTETDNFELELKIRRDYTFGGLSKREEQDLRSIFNARLEARQLVEKRKELTAHLNPEEYKKTYDTALRSVGNYK